jgi:hypothetical protein
VEERLFFSPADTDRTRNRHVTSRFTAQKIWQPRRRAKNLQQNPLRRKWVPAIIMQKKEKAWPIPPTYLREAPSAVLPPFLLILLLTKLLRVYFLLLLLPLREFIFHLLSTYRLSTFLHRYRILPLIPL